MDLIGNGFFDFYPGNGLYVDMSGSTGQNGTLETKQTFGPGTYDLTFDIGHNSGDPTTDSVNVILGDTTLSTAHDK